MLKKILFAAVLLFSGSMDAFAHRNDNWGSGYWGDCRYYNRDGITCNQVGFFEGQVGSPWGFDAGQFRCINGCLQYVGSGGGYTANSCYALNRDGITCAQVGLYEGQIGAPWGRNNGYFRCTGGCLQFVGN
jgi:hypothetical protein